MATTFPGFDTPAVGFEQPFEMLRACHERVRRSLALLARLIDHVAAHGHDANTRSAAADVLRYFEQAAPLHHEDEERHVFPLLAAGSDAGIVAAVAGLRAEHRHMESLWGGLRGVLRAWTQPDAAPGVDAPLRAQAAAFAALYAGHLRTEESVVFPAAEARANASQRTAMSIDMEQRRRAAAVC